MKMISRRDFIKASAVVGAAGVLTACGGSSSSTAASSVAASSTAAASSEAAASGSANIGVCIYQFADNFMTLYRTDLEGWQERPEHPDRADQHLPAAGRGRAGHQPRPDHFRSDHRGYHLSVRHPHRLHQP